MKTMQIVQQRMWCVTWSTVLKQGARVGVGLLVLAALVACSPPSGLAGDIQTASCEWVDFFYTGGLAVLMVLGVLMVMIIAVAHLGGGIVWNSMHQLATRLQDGAVFALAVVGVGLPAFAMVMSAFGANTCGIQVLG